MSVTKIVYVHCDGCGENIGSDGADSGMTAMEQRASAKGDGWITRLGGKDFCAGCAAAPRTPEQPAAQKEEKL